MAFFLVFTYDCVTCAECSVGKIYDCCSNAFKPITDLFPKQTAKIRMVYRIVAAVCKQIIVPYVSVCSDLRVRIQKSSGRRVVVTTVEAIQPCFRNVVVAPVTDSFDQSGRS